MTGKEKILRGARPLTEKPLHLLQQSSALSAAVVRHGVGREMGIGKQSLPGEV